MPLRVLRYAVVVFLIPPAALVLYFLLAFVGAALPQSPDMELPSSEGGATVEILLFAGPIHYDFILPLTAQTRAKFQFLEAEDVAVSDPHAANLLVGWGSRAFYTTTGSYSDVRLSVIFRAATGDDSVMHVAALGHLAPNVTVERVELTAAGYTRLLEFVSRSFTRNATNEVIAIEGADFGFGDVFFHSPEWFHLLKPCNIWIADGLRRAGIHVGRWTPTVQSLKFSLWLNGALVSDG